MKDLFKIDSCILTLYEKLPRNCLGGRYVYGNERNTSIILAFIKFIYSSKRSDGQLM